MVELLKKNAHVSQLSLVRNDDRTMLYIFLISLAVCVAMFFALTITSTLEIGWALMLISVPFFVMGLITYAQKGMWKSLIVILIISAALLYFYVAPLVMFFVAFLLVGCVGVVSVAVVLQRYVFFSVISSVEYINVKSKLSLWERLVIFAFNIPPDIDTRKITMDHNLKRSGIPFREMLETMFFAFLVGVALWINLSMNPAFMTDIRLYEAPIFVFSLIMFIPLIVLPWTPFKSLNVRITTGYRDFSLYGGAVETLRRMAIPVFAVFVFIMVAVNRTSLAVVIGFIASSVVFNMIVVAASAVIYYLLFESSFVDDAAIKWKIFRPIPISTDLSDNDVSAIELPGTPARDLSDIGEMDVT